jgi:hypothetical protein
MIEAIMLFLRLTKDARTAPAISGKLAMKPQIRESNIVPADEVNYIFTADYGTSPEYKSNLRIQS